MHRRPQAEVSLQCGDESRKRSDSVRRKMMRLKAEVVKKFSSEIAKRETKSTREVRHKNHILALPNIRRGLAAGKATRSLGGNSSSPDKPFDLTACNRGPLPRASLGPRA